jgi:hypothetical protein
MEETYTPETVEDCLKIIDKLLPEDQKEEIKTMELFDFKTAAHFGLGMWIRNNLGAWNLDSPLVKNTGMSGDMLSSFILEAYHTHLTQA